MRRRGVGRLATKLRRRTKFEIAPLPPFDFGLTVRKPAGWDLFTSKEVYEAGTLWTGIRFEGRPIGLKIQSSGTVESPLVLVGVYAAGAISMKDAGRMRDILTACLGAKQDLKDFYGFAVKDEILRHVVDDLYGMHDTQAVSLFNSVILGICLQMARLTRSREMMQAIDRKYGETIEFDEKRVVLQPTAERIARLDPKTFAKECKLGYRARYIVASAKMIAGGFPDTLGIMAMPPEEAKEKLMELPGIGDYAADIINPHAGFPIDAWSVDVFGLLFFGREPENRREAIEEVKKEGIRRWGRWSWMAFFYVAQDLRNLSKRLGIELRLD
jgi:3-methyladenine DNA glycosylase/8-oxoguanine DNA glycosylase